MTQPNKNRDLALDLYRAIDAQDFERAQALVSPRFQACMGGKQLDFASWKAMGQMFMTAFPDGRHVFDLTEAAGDYVLSHGYFTGTHTQEFHGIPATGRVIKCSMTMIDRIIDDKLVEHYGDFDSGSLMQQLMQPKRSMIELSKERPGVAAEVADGFWIVATQHHPGGSHQFPEINNRCLVFRIVEDGTARLLVINGVDASAIAEVQRLEQQTGLAVRYMLSPGGGHHVLLPPWVEAFPQASVLVGPERIPRTASGKKLLAMPRVSTFDPSAVLPQLKGQLEFVSFRGLLGAPDHKSPGEGGRDGVLMLVNMMLTMLFRMKDPVDELWTFHVPTRTLIGGENLGWMYPQAQHADLPGLIKGMVVPDSVYLFKDARKVANAAVVDACWREILKWPAEAVLTYHDPAGHGFIGDGRAALEAAVRCRGQLLA